VTDFHNPSNFIPAPPPSVDPPDGLCQGRPAAHDRFHDTLYTGSIAIEVTVITPLLIPDEARRESVRVGNKGEHFIFDVRTGPDGKPLLPVTSLKGALRSYYEAVTNSRFGVFGKEQTVPLARRMQPEEALGLVPARIAGDGRQLELYLGSEIPVSGCPLPLPVWKVDSKTKRPRWHPPADRMAAAWLWRRDPAVNYQDDEERPRHGDDVFCEIELWKKGDLFEYWKVLGLVRASKARQLQATASPERRGRHESVLRDGRLIRHSVYGVVYAGGGRFPTKKNERVFFQLPAGNEAPENPTLARIELPSEIGAAFEQLLEDFQRSAKGPEQRGKPGIYADERQAKSYRDKCLCYALFEKDGSSRLVGLYPAMIGRELARWAPRDLLDPRLHPATSIEALSPADRVFGWASQDDSGPQRRVLRAHKGQLRIRSIVCATKKIEDAMEAGCTLAPLSAPKPQQARFHMARDDQGTPLVAADSVREQGAFSRQPTSWRLRGRKVYPHHTDGMLKATFAGTEQSTQNRTIKRWVKPGAIFLAQIDVINLNRAELGALLWLLDLPEKHFLRLGSGKPLGFGSVKIRVTGSELRTGAELRPRYESLWGRAITPEQAQLRGAAICAYRSEIEQRYGAQFEDVRFISGFLNAVRGLSNIHYPTELGRSVADRKSYGWFVNNARAEAAGKAQSLGALYECPVRMVQENSS